MTCSATALLAATLDAHGVDLINCVMPAYAAARA